MLGTHRLSSWPGVFVLAKSNEGQALCSVFAQFHPKGWRTASDVDLPDEALVSKQFVLVEQFVDNLLRASDKERVLFPGFPLILRATERHVPDPVPSQRLEIVGPIRIECLQCLLGGLRYMDIAGHCDFERRRIMPSALSRPPIEIDQVRKARSPPAKNAQIHGQYHST